MPDITVTPSELQAIIDSSNSNGVVLSNICTLLQVFLVLIGIFISYKGAMYIYKGLIMRTIRSYIKFKI